MKLLLIVGLAAAIAVLALAGVGGTDRAAGRTEAAPAGRIVTVSGTGTATVVPDRAAFSFGVTTRGSTATQALSANAAEMRRVIDAVKAAGVASKDVQTAAVFLSPRYSQDGEQILGYTASNTVSATIRGVAKSGAVVDAAVRAGANEVSGPVFTRGDVRVLYRRALKLAVADARAKATALARAGRVGLARVRSIAESSAVTPVAEAAGARGAEPATPPIEPGTQTIQATVTVEFSLR